MPNRIDIDHRHSRAILREIGERLRGSLREEPELPENLRKLVDRLHEFEDQSPSIVGTREPVQGSQAGPDWTLSDERSNILHDGRSGFGPMGRYRRGS